MIKISAVRILAGLAVIMPARRKRSSKVVTTKKLINGKDTGMVNQLKKILLNK